MTGVCRQLWAVDVSDAVRALPSTVFVNTGGTNGWIAQPAWLPAFVERLGLGGRLSYAVCRKLPAGQGIPVHVDASQHPSNVGRRFHVPLVTHPAVTFRWPDDGVEVHLAAGHLYELQVDRLHEVINRAPVDRVHVVLNIIDPVLRDVTRGKLKWN
jgi:hypothetical protein